jgi:VanZ family protein
MVLPLNSAQQLNDIMVLSFRGDYLLHAIVFMPWMYFCLIYRHGVFLWMSIGLMFAACSEGLQYLLPYRAFNINDLVANMMGVLLGSLLYLIFALFNKPRVP